MKLKNLGNTIAILLLPISLASSSKPFSAPETCQEAHSEEIYHIARTVWSECRGEGRDGKLAVISALRNGARGYKVGKLDNSLVELVSEEMKKPVRHPYKHWIVPDRATDKRQLAIAMKAMKDGNGFWVGSHWVY